MDSKDLHEAQRRLERYLEDKHPDFRTLSPAQAEDVLSLRVFDIWCAWHLLVKGS